MIQQVTTTKNKTIYINTDYVFKLTPKQNGAVIHTEVENFFLRSSQDIEVVEATTNLTKITDECVFVTLLSDDKVYLNKKYIFKIIPQQDKTEIYISVKAGLKEYRIYEVKETVQDILSQYDKPTAPQSRAYSSAYSSAYS